MRKLFLLCFIVMLGTTANASVYRGWDIDSQMKFNVEYLPDTNVQQVLKKPRKEKPLLKPYYKFDVNNINLVELLNLGFDIPTTNKPEENNFYIKLYNLPGNISNKLISKKLANDFALSFGYDFSDLNSFVSKRQNVVVKFSHIAPQNSVFTKKKPIPQFLTSNNADFSNYFLDHIPFYSIYLVPTQKTLKTSASANDVAKWSTGGVKDFQAELISYYKRNFCEFKGNDKKYYYFWISRVDNEKIVIVKIPKEILVFDNWRDLPMPQNPKKIFLSSSLLISSFEYQPKNGKIPAMIPSLNSEEFNNVFSLKKTTIFEVASVTRLN